MYFVFSILFWHCADDDDELRFTIRKAQGVK